MNWLNSSIAIVLAFLIGCSLVFFSEQGRETPADGDCTALQAVIFGWLGAKS